MLEHDKDQASRREFLKSSLTLGSGLVIGFYLPFREIAKAVNASITPNLDFRSPSLPNAFVKISPDNSVRLIISKLEMGQGVNTSLAQLIAEELECDWSQISCESAPVAPEYNATFMPTQMAGGSTSVSSSYDQLRTVGAMAREMLIAAAAEQWKVSPKECQAKQGFVLHPKKGKLSYGQLAEAAAKQTPPFPIKLKEPKDFQVIGTSRPRTDSAAKVTGQAKFGIDVRLPGMVFAVVARPPFGARIKSYDEAAARKVSGFQGVYKLDGDKLAFVANHTWAAIKAREAAQIQWHLSDDPQLTQKGLARTYHEFLDKAGVPVKPRGNTKASFKKSAHSLEATYEFPFLAHASMEPLNCTIAYDGQSAQMWSGHQIPTVDRMVAAKILGIAPEKVAVTTTYAGGSFGRRASKDSDFVVETATLAKQLKKPVQLVWTREDDTRGGYYRPYTLHKVKAGLDANGKINAWQHKIVGQGVMAGSMFGADIDKSGIDPTSIEGIDNSPYAIENFDLQLKLTKLPVPALWWRSVGHTHTAFVMETMIDELATLAGKDALQFRKESIAQSPRHHAVLDLLAQKSDWGKNAPKGRAYGLAVHESFQSVVGHVVEVSWEGEEIKVHKIVSAVDCGLVVNPKGAQAQIESAIVYGLSACLYGKLTLDKGQVQQSNFHDYQMLRFKDMPVVEVHFVPSTAKPTGLGEPGLPPLAPAIANALFRLKGKRFREQPFQMA